ncbi:hypothetical protein KEM56_004845 [Ascosphaera pollenicola]|nr:hypothetical protein KEM56_004845 [Ascosphaera pollenicola]
MTSNTTQTELETLFAESNKAKDNSYCPYSKFRVGCCILTVSGEFISGCNVENAAFPVGICAEKNAIGTAVAAGHRDFKAIAVSSDISPGASPCGNCRQFIIDHEAKSIREFAPPNLPIYMVDKDGKSTMMTMEQIPSWRSGELIQFGEIKMTNYIDM